MEELEILEEGNQMVVDQSQLFLQIANFSSQSLLCAPRSSNAHRARITTHRCYPTAPHF
jgi:hypothetical protein